MNRFLGNSHISFGKLPFLNRMDIWSEKANAICIPLFKLISGVMRLKVGKFQATREYKDLIQHIFPSFTFSWFWKNDNADGNFTKLANFNFPNFKNSCVSVEFDQTPGSTIPPLLSRTENLDTVCVDWLFCSEDGAQKTTQN